MPVCVQAKKARCPVSVPPHEQKDRQSNSHFMSFAEQRKEPSQHFHLYAASDGLETSTIPFTRNKYKKTKSKKKKKRAFGFATLCFLLHLKKKKKRTSTPARYKEKPQTENKESNPWSAKSKEQQGNEEEKSSLQVQNNEARLTKKRGKQKKKAGE